MATVLNDAERAAATRTRVAGLIDAEVAQGRWDVDTAGAVRARIAVGACSAVAQRLPALEAALEGQPLRAAVDSITEAYGLKRKQVYDAPERPDVTPSIGRDVQVRQVLNPEPHQKNPLKGVPRARVLFGDTLDRLRHERGDGACIVAGHSQGDKRPGNESGQCFKGYPFGHDVVTFFVRAWKTRRQPRRPARRTQVAVVRSNRIIAANPEGGWP